MNIVLAILLSWAVSQILKVILLSMNSRKFEWTAIFFAGGMPSVHSTLVASLATSIYLTQGLTPLFIATAVFAFIIMYDAMTLRRTVKSHALLLQKLYEKMDLEGVKLLTKNGGIGHTVLEVFAGALIGIVVPFLLNL